MLVENRHLSTIHNADRTVQILSTIHTVIVDKEGCSCCGVIVLIIVKLPWNICYTNLKNVNNSCNL